jgi:hypothetical protein
MTEYGSKCVPCSEYYEPDSAGDLKGRCACGDDLTVLSEPLGAGTDPYGRPDPRTHPEAWTE